MAALITAEAENAKDQSDTSARTICYREENATLGTLTPGIWRVLVRHTYIGSCHLDIPVPLIQNYSYMYDIFRCGILISNSISLNDSVAAV